MDDKKYSYSAPNLDESPSLEEIWGQADIRLSGDGRTSQPPEITYLDGKIVGRVLAAKVGDKGWVLQLRRGKVSTYPPKQLLGAQAPKTEE